MRDATRVSRRPVLPSILVALAALGVGVAPAAADTELGHTGQVGAHSLRESYSDGGAKCTYRTTFEGQSSHWWRLRRIDVRPPRVRAISGQQVVGWRFIVQRSEDGGRWERTYRSPIQKATASTSANAAFSSMGIKIIVPAPSSQFSNHYQYRVVVKMFWYRANGTQRGTARHLVDFYREQFDGEVSAGDGDGACWGIKGQVV
jgi:hypothetical protein